MIYLSNQFIGTIFLSIHQISRWFFLPCQDVSYKFGGVRSPAFYDTLMWRLLGLDQLLVVYLPLWKVHVGTCPSLNMHTSIEYCLADSGWGQPNSYLYLAEFISIFSSDAF